MAESRMPEPRLLGGARGQAHGTPNVEVEVVEARRTPGHLGEKTMAGVVDGQHTRIKDDAAAHLLQLTETDDVRLELGDVVDSRQCSVLAVLAHEHNGTAPLDLHHGAVAEPDVAAHLGVKLGEGVAAPGHVISGPSVQDPEVIVSLLPGPQICVDLLLVDDDAALRRRRWWSLSTWGQISAPFLEAISDRMALFPVIVADDALGRRRRWSLGT